MPRGHAARRESKKPKKSAAKKPIVPDNFTSTEVEVVPKRRKPNPEED